MPPSVLSPPTLPELDDHSPPGAHPVGQLLVLAVLWCRDEPWRVGEVLVAPADSVSWLGRGPADPEGPPKTHPSQLRPGRLLPSSPLGALSLSRYQLRLEAKGNLLLLHNPGRVTMLHNGVAATEARCEQGDLIQLGKQLLLLCVRRSARPSAQVTYPDFPFGEADPYGIVGESAAAWELRQQIAFLAARDDSILISGRRGSGNELVARAIHALSSRKRRPLVAINAAILPTTLIDGHLFGNCENVPAPGMAEKCGLLAEADAATLFVDEVDALPGHTRAHLWRSVEERGYHRLGDARRCASDFRLIAATTGQEEPQTENLSPYFDFVLQVPLLSARREDIPLLVRHLLRQGATRGDDVALRCFPDGNSQSQPNISLALICKLLEPGFALDVRQLKVELWRSLAAEQLGFDEAPASAGVSAWHPSAAPSADSSPPDLPVEAAEDAASAERVTSTELSAELVQRALDENNGVVETTWRALGLKNRFVLLRLIKRYDLEIRKRPAQSTARSTKR